ncbi:DUF6011 domain-containing protein [Skermania sp. ID1734]|uniref:DUF6011 domain-containing protein n=1 Tax=Skermania sp. ID1734 TaxID=2597516 RepID=UPI001C8F43DE
MTEIRNRPSRRTGAARDDHQATGSAVESSGHAIDGTEGATPTPQAAASVARRDPCTCAAVRCRICGRELTARKSVARHVGPRCAAHVEAVTHR